MVTLNIHFRDTTSHLLQQVAGNMTPGESLHVSLLALLHALVLQKEWSLPVAIIGIGLQDDVSQSIDGY